MRKKILLEDGRELLIHENCGYIDPLDSRNKTFINEVAKLDEGKTIITEPLLVYAVLQKYGIENKNGRIYPEHILRREAKNYEELIRQNSATGVLDHPQDSIISGKEISHTIKKLWWEDHTLLGEIEIEMSPGFIRYGIISCEGDRVANLLRKKVRICVSSRGVGSVKEVQGRTIVQEDFELICWDIVTNPSTPGSWITNTPQETKQFVESKSNDKPLLENKLNDFLDNFLL